tara:strand:+ start:335 stop:463 length:129 start_codon:yes stop_codon:yes gene_type:complete
MKGTKKQIRKVIFVIDFNIFEIFIQFTKKRGFAVSFFFFLLE